VAGRPTPGLASKKELPAVDQATHNKSFNCPVCKRQPLRAPAEFTALVSDRLVRGNFPVERASSSRQIVVTVSQESAARLGAGFDGYAPTQMARLVWWMPSAIGHLQGGCAARRRQMLVTVSRVLTPHQGLGLNSAEIARTPGGREVGLAAGQA
jgi:hypothetical protein